MLAKCEHIHGFLLHIGQRTRYLTSICQVFLVFISSFMCASVQFFCSQGLAANKMASRRKIKLRRRLWWRCENSKEALLAISWTSNVPGFALMHVWGQCHARRGILHCILHTGRQASLCRRRSWVCASRSHQRLGHVLPLLVQMMSRFHVTDCVYMDFSVIMSLFPSLIIFRGWCSHARKETWAFVVQYAW